VTIDSGWGAVSASPLPGGRAALVGFCRPGCQEVQLRAIALDGRPHRVLAGEVTRGWYIGNGEVVFSRQDGGVFRAPFAFDSLTFTAPPTPVLDGLRAIPGRADMVLGADGTLLYIAGAAASAGIPAEAVWVTREGAVSPIEAGWTFVPSADFGFDLAPDGRQLAMSTQSGDGSDVWLKIIGGPFTRLTFGGINVRPTYSADSRTVMYASRRTGEPGNRVRARRADGTGAESTLVANGRSVFEIVRLRDTTRLVLRYTAPPSRDVFVGRIGDSVLTPLLASPTFNEVMPALSPDERWLAYASDESGRFEIYVRPFPAVDAGRWQVSRAGGIEPMWSHSGRELFYRDGAGNLVAVAVGRGTVSFEGGAQRLLFAAGDFRSGGNKTHYYPTPDDRRFVFVRNVGGQEERAAAAYVVQVRNWFTELRAQARAGGGAR
jgi:serine/threonine-protein kinase